MVDRLFNEDYFDNNDITTLTEVTRTSKTTPFSIDREYGYCGEKRIVGGYASFSGGVY